MLLVDFRTDRCLLLQGANSRNTIHATRASSTSSPSSKYTQISRYSPLKNSEIESHEYLTYLYTTILHNVVTKRFCIDFQIRLTHCHRAIYLNRHFYNISPLIEEDIVNFQRTYCYLPKAWSFFFFFFEFLMIFIRHILDC